MQLFQIDPDYKETDQLSPAYQPIINLINTALYEERMKEIGEGFALRHHPLVKGKNTFKQFMKSNIKQVRFYRELNGSAYTH